MPLLFLGVFSLEAQSQAPHADCATTHTDIAPPVFLQMGDCNSVDSDYAPSEDCPECTPIRYLKVNVHVVRETGQDNNFQEDDMGIQVVKEILKRANRRLADNRLLLKSWTK